LWNIKDMDFIDYLVKKKILTEDQKKWLEEKIRKTGLSLEELILQEKIIEEKELFKIKCKKAKIDFERVRKKLFYSRGNYLFWKEKIDEKKYIEILGRPAEGIKDIVKIFRETLQEKEKFWKMISLKGEIPPRANKNLIGKNLELINSSTSIFVILPIFEWLFLGDILKGNPSQYRVNFPGKVSKRNFSLRLPISLEKLLNLQINKAIKKILEKTSRIN